MHAYTEPPRKHTRAQISVCPYTHIYTYTYTYTVIKIHMCTFKAASSFLIVTGNFFFKLTSVSACVVRICVKIDFTVYCTRSWAHK